MKHGITWEKADFTHSGFHMLFEGLNFGIVFHSIGESENLGQAPNPDPLLAQIRIVHLWEDQWTFHEKKMKSRLRSLLGISQRIHGRETEVTAIDNQQLIEFLARNHLNVPLKAKYKFGLFGSEGLLAVMSFSKPRPILREGQSYASFELLRFCNRLNLTVVGGFSKLLHHFITKYNPDDIMTYVDADWSEGDYLKALGFTKVDKLPGMEFWLNTETGVREYPDLVLKKHKKTMEDIGTQEQKDDFIQKMGYSSVYNSGSYKYLLKRK